MPDHVDHQTPGFLGKPVQPAALLGNQVVDPVLVNLSPELRLNVQGSLLVPSNMLGTLGQQWDNYPAVDSWHANANLIAYWVRQGAAVLVCERHKDPEVLIETIIRAAARDEGDCTPVLFDVFEAPGT